MLKLKKSFDFIWILHLLLLSLPMLKPRDGPKVTLTLVAYDTFKSVREKSSAHKEETQCGICASLEEIVWSHLSLSRGGSVWG